MKKIGILGLGNIGYSIATAVAEGRVPGARVAAVLDAPECPNLTGAAALSNEPVAVCHTLDELLALELDIVVEAANPAAVRDSAQRILESGKDFMIMSVGGLIEPGMLDKLTELANASGRQIIVPAGAITGLNIAAAGMSVADGLETAIVQSTKSPTGIQSAPYFQEHPEIDLNAITEPTVVYEGNVFDAVKNFPQNVNIAASMALSGFGPERTVVQMKCDPNATTIRQTITLRGVFGEADIDLRLLPSPNKRSSYLASLSGIAALKKYVSPIKLGY